MTLAGRRKLYRFRNYLRTPDGFSALCALVTLAGIVSWFWRRA